MQMSELQNLFSLLELCYFWRSSRNLEEMKFAWRSLFEAAYEIYGVDFIENMNRERCTDQEFILDLEDMILSRMQELLF